MNQLIAAWRRPFDFKGRATRREYWGFVGALVALVMVVGLILYPGDGAPPSQQTSSPLFGLLFGSLYILAMVVWIAVGIRRLHDQDKSGWFLLVALFPLFGQIFHLVMMLTPGTDGPNAYGDDPRDPLPGSDEASLQAL